MGGRNETVLNDRTVFGCYLLNGKLRRSAMIFKRPWYRVIHV